MQLNSSKISLRFMKYGIHRKKCIFKKIILKGLENIQYGREYLKIKSNISINIFEYFMYIHCYCDNIDQQIRYSLFELFLYFFRVFVNIKLINRYEINKFKL